MQVDARDFVEQMAMPMWQASAVARFLQGRVSNRPKHSEDHPAKSALTDADCVSQEILLGALRAHYPWIEVEAEEDTPLAEAFASNRSDQQVVIDPIDGTLRYIQQDGLYAIILGLERGGTVEAALVAVPQEDLLVRSVRGQGAEMARAGGAFRKARLDGDGARLLISHSLDDDAEARLVAAGLEPVKAAGGAIGLSPLLAGTLGAIRISHRPHGLSRRAWIACLATLEAGGAAEALDGPFPAAYQEGIHGTIVAASAAGIETLRESLLGRGAI